MTVKGSDGRPVQVSQAMVAQAQMGLVQPGPDGTVTIPGPDGKPVKIAQAALAAAAPSVLPNMAAGTLKLKLFPSHYSYQELSYFTKEQHS